MAKKPTVTTLQSGFNSTETLNANFEALRDGFDNTLSLDGSTPNAMEADLDLNGNNLIGAAGLLVNGTDYLAAVEAAKAAALIAQAAAETAETNAETAETNAESSETAAGLSATAAATSETNAGASETAASGSATASATSATNSATSSSEAAASASAASTSETNAATSATNAATSETNAATSATESETAKTAAEAAKDAALAALDSFDDRYLGAKASDPTLDNDGNALVAGALYYNTTDDVMKVYEGSIWVAAYASLSGALLATNNLSDLANAATARTNLGLGTAATTAATDYATAAQGVLADTATQPGDLGTAATSAATDFVAVTGDSMTGNLSFGDNDKAIFGAGSDLQVFHDGANSYILDNGTGNLVIQSNGTDIQLASSPYEVMLRAYTNGAVELFHDGSNKLQTTSVGINVTGTVTATSYAGDGSALTGLPAGYTDADVDTHLNTSTATADQVLSWTGSDYDWADAASGAGGGGSDEIFWENGQNVTTNYTITNGKNAMSAGPITINSGVTVTVGAGETWTVI